MSEYFTHDFNKGFRINGIILNELGINFVARYMLYFLSKFFYYCYSKEQEDVGDERK